MSIAVWTQIRFNMSEKHSKRDHLCKMHERSGRDHWISVEIRGRSVRDQGEISQRSVEISERSGGDQSEISGDQPEISVRSVRDQWRSVEIRERSVRDQWRAGRDQ